MTLTARIRVLPGRISCSAQHQAGERLTHAMLASTGHLPADISFYHCDVCYTNTTPASLHRCSRGCNFDVCTTCLTPARHRTVDTMILGWGCRELELRGESFAP